MANDFLEKSISSGENTRSEKLNDSSQVEFDKVLDNLGKLGGGIVDSFGQKIDDIHDSEVLDRLLIDVTKVLDELKSSVNQITGLDNLANWLKEFTPVDLNNYLDSAKLLIEQGKGISKETLEGLDFFKYSRYGLNKGPLLCADFVSNVLGLFPVEYSISQSLLPLMLAGLMKNNVDIKATSKYLGFEEGKVYALLFYEEEVKSDLLTHIALGVRTTIQTNEGEMRCVYAVHEGTNGAEIVVILLDKGEISLEDIEAHLVNNSNTFLSKMGEWYGARRSKGRRLLVRENGANGYWSDGYNKNGKLSTQAFVFGLEIEEIINLEEKNIEELENKTSS